MQRRHPMPFGVDLSEDGRACFRLWAPAASRVDLCLEQGSEEILLPMPRGAQGWFHLATAQAAAGSRYRYRIDGGLRVPDPASRFQPQDVHGPSEVVDPLAWQWTDPHWRGRPWEEAIIYELHLGTFSPNGGFSGVLQRLDYLCDLGITAIELMPIADFHGARNWGYDGVLPFAPDSSYGRPEDLKALVQAAHRRGLMIFLDVVYNHFGPAGNFLHLYAPQFFAEQRRTPWGAAINFDGPDSETVRRFFIHNALYWLEEYHLDGLRLDAVDTILDTSCPDILEELAQAVRRGPGRNRQIHLVLENDNNQTRYLARGRGGQPSHYRAQWNDDIHHALHVLLSGESGGCYGDYQERPIWYLARALAQGFAYQGEPSTYRGGCRRGQESRSLPPSAFVSFLQNHDQTGNRPWGERLHVLSHSQPLGAALTLLLLAPSPPLLFMGEEFAASQPFRFFCDFDPELAAAVTAGRMQGYARHQEFADSVQSQRPPDPNDPSTFQDSKLRWEDLRQASHSQWLGFYRNLLALRRREIIPRLAGMQTGAGECRLISPHGLRIQWLLGDDSTLTLLANLGPSSLAVSLAELATGQRICTYPCGLIVNSRTRQLPSWCVSWCIRKPPA